MDLPLVVVDDTINIPDIKFDEIEVIHVSDLKYSNMPIYVGPIWENKYGYFTGQTNNLNYFGHVSGKKLMHTNSCQPRLLIKTKDTPYMCDSTETCVVPDSSDRNLTDALLFAKNWALPYLNRESKSICVFDLDEVLIDSSNHVYDLASNVLESARNNYDYVVLWSHGGDYHVDLAVQDLKFDFDLVLSKRIYSGPKSLLSLYTFFPHTQFINATLIDDTAENVTPEYSKLYLVSRNNDALINLSQQLEESLYHE